MVRTGPSTATPWEKAGFWGNPDGCSRVTVVMVVTLPVILVTSDAARDARSRDPQAVPDRPAVPGLRAHRRRRALGRGGADPRRRGRRLLAGAGAGPRCCQGHGG